MSVRRAPLWKQLAALWLGAATLVVGLVWLQLRQPYQFYWLLPYPTWRLLWPDWAVLFRDVPFVGAAWAVSLFALAATLALCVRRAASLVRGAGAGGKHTRAAV